MDNLAAKRYGIERSADDVVFLNENDEVASTTMANIFVETDKGFVTPPLAAGILPGITRDAILREAAATGAPVVSAPLLREDLLGCRLYRTNSLIGVRPAWLDEGRMTPKPSMPKSSLLVELYQDAVAKESFS